MDFAIEKMEKLPADFYYQPVLKTAKRLLGKYFVRRYNGKYLVGKIVETEAYHQDNDSSCHAHRGKTKRNEVMFGPPGHLYVYFTYGMHYCSNVVCEEENRAAAVLLRAVEPVAGVEMMQHLRGPKFGLKQLAAGPARFCQAFGIGKAENGADLFGEEIFIAAGRDEPSEEIVTTTRIGISSAVELPWRFYLKGNEFVSKPNRG